MKMIFVGGGPSSLLASILIKKKHPNMDVMIIEKNLILGKKLKATGNGRCNVSPMELDFDNYSNSNFVKESLKGIDKDSILQTLKEIGIATKSINNFGYYPVSESANSVVNLFISKIKELNIEVRLETKLLDYKIKDNIEVSTDKGKLFCDYLVFATGGKSMPDLGSDGNLFPLLLKHGYHITEMYPSLCPILVKENIKDLAGVRTPAYVRVYDKNGNHVFGEIGEVQFRKDSLSGIVIFNASRYLLNQKDYSIHLDVLTNGVTNISKKEFMNLSSFNKDYALSIINEKLLKYISNGKENPEELYDKLINITFNFKGLYDFKNSQVTRGGISLNQIDLNYQSKIEKGVYMLGEMLDVDGPCGGYNLSFAFASAIKFSNKF